LAFISDISCAWDIVVGDIVVGARDLDEQVRDTGKEPKGFAGSDFY
jgi:hypothetical protein